MKQIFDEIRGQWVAATPEEIVRQRWIQKMIKGLGFPKELIVVEKELRMLPHLASVHHQLPSRRIDVLSFVSVDEKGVFPLLLMECKAEPLTSAVLQQALAYNTFVNAGSVAIVNERGIILKVQNFELDHLPSFSELVKVVCG